MLDKISKSWYDEVTMEKDEQELSEKVSKLMDDFTVAFDAMIEMYKSLHQKVEESA